MRCGTTGHGAPAGIVAPRRIRGQRRQNAPGARIVAMGHEHIALDECAQRILRLLGQSILYQRYNVRGRMFAGLDCQIILWAVSPNTRRSSPMWTWRARWADRASRGRSGKSPGTSRSSTWPERPANSGPRRCAPNSILLQKPFGPAQLMTRGFATAQCPAVADLVAPGHQQRGLRAADAGRGRPARSVAQSLGLEYSSLAAALPAASRIDSAAWLRLRCGPESRTVACVAHDQDPLARMPLLHISPDPP